MKPERKIKSIFCLKPAAFFALICALVFAAEPVLAAPASQSQGNNTHGSTWEQWQPLAEGYVARRRVPERLELPKEERRPPATQEKAQPGRDRRPWERLSLWFCTDAAGLYSISLDEVAAETGVGANQLHGAANSGRLSFLNAGAPVSWYYDAKQRRILFAGETYETFHAEGNAYQLVQTQRPDPQRMTEQRKSRFRSSGHQAPFREWLYFEEEKDMMIYLWLNPSNPDARYWFWDYLYGSARPRLDVPLHVPNPAASGTARIRARLHGFTDLYPGDDHRVFAEINGYAAGQVLSWDGLNQAELIIDFDQARLNADGGNTLTLRSDYDAARPRPGQFLESIVVEYDRMPVAVNGQVWMRDVEQGVLEATGFAGSDIFVIESPARNAVLRRDVHIYQDWDGKWAVSFEAREGSDYLISEPSAFLTPVLDAREQSTLTAEGKSADYLIIAPREFAGTAQALAAHRRSNFGTAEIAWLDDIYKHFSAGRVDPFAIGRFIHHVRTRWAMEPSVVTLIGKGSLDRKNRMGYGDNFLPILMTSNPWNLAPSDARLLGFDDGVVPFALGRLPITSDLEGLAYLEKLFAHEMDSDGVHAQRAVVVADRPDRGGNFHKDADELALQLHRLGFGPVTKLYHATHAVRVNLIAPETWESGFVSYSGHGSLTRIGNANFFNVSDAAALRNVHYPIFAALTCSVGLDVFPGTRSLAAALVLNPEGGAIASLAPTGMSANADAHVLGGAFVDHFFGRYNTIGDALAGATHQTSGRISHFMAPMYIIIGDPAVTAP